MVDAELYELLTDVGRRGFLMHTFQLDRAERPSVVAGVLHRGDCADVVILYSEVLAYSFRAPAGDGRDVLDPTEVFWDCPGKALRAIKALLALPEPGAEGAPRIVYAPPPGMTLPAALRGQPLRVRKRGI